MSRFEKEEDKTQKDICGPTDGGPGEKIVREAHADIAGPKPKTRLSRSGRSSCFHSVMRWSHMCSEGKEFVAFFWSEKVTGSRNRGLKAVK